MLKRIYFILEVKKRELLSRVFASIYLLNNGFEVVIGKKYSFEIYSKFLKNGIYLFKGFGSKNINLVKKIKEDGNIIIGTDEEGLMVSHHTEIKNSGRINKNCMELADLFFCWGNYHKEQILKVFPEFSHKIRPIGNLRLDVTKKEFSKSLDNETQEIKKKYGDFILLTTKFSSSNNAGYDKFPSRREYPFREYTFQNEIMKKTFEFIKIIEKEEIKILLKPHPAENRSFWIKFLTQNKIKNTILADDNYQTNSYINSCNLNISSNCTTSLEAAMLNKKTINFIPFRDELIEFELFNKISLNCYSTNELVNTCKNFIKNDKIANVEEDEREIFIKKYIGNFKDNCIDLMINEFNKLNSKERKNLRQIDHKTNLFNFFYFKFLRIIKNIYYKIRNEKKMIELSKRKFPPGLSKKEVYTMFEMFDFITKKMDFKIDIQEIYPGCYLFKKK